MPSEKSLKNLRPGWKKGQSGNPKGGKIHKPELKKLKALTEDELIEVGTLVVKGDVEGLEKIHKDKKSTVLSAMLAGVALKSIHDGDSKALNALLDRILGKVKERVEHTGDLSVPQVIVTLPSNGREVNDGTEEE